MTGHQAIRTKIARCFQQVLELHTLVAANARDWRKASEIGVGKIVDHRFFKAAFVIQHIMGNSDLIGDPAGVMDVLPSAACTLLLKGSSMVIEL